MVVIKYALAGCLVALGIFAFSKRDAVLAAYEWDPTIDKTLIPSFDPKAVAEEHALPVPESDIEVRLGPDTRAVAVPTVVPATSTSALPMQGGKAALEGQVIGPDSAPIPGATVRIERFVGDDVVTVDVATNATGSFAVNQLLGGRYRVRAWRAPTFAQLGSEVTFLADGDRRAMRLQLAAPNDIDISASATASAVIVGQPTTVTMRILTPVVNGNGQVDMGGRANDLVVATGGGVLIGQSGQATSNAEGTATFTFQCVQVGAGSVTMQTPYYKETVDITCLPLPTTTTAPPTTTTVAGATTTTVKVG